MHLHTLKSEALCHRFHFSESTVFFSQRKTPEASSETQLKGHFFLFGIKYVTNMIHFRFKTMSKRLILCIQYGKISLKLLTGHFKALDTYFVEY